MNVIEIGNEGQSMKEQGSIVLMKCVSGAVAAAIVAASVVVIGASAHSAGFDDEPPAAEEQAAPPAQPSRAELRARRQAERAHQEATDPRLIAEARLAVAEALLKGVDWDMGSTERQKQPITREGVLKSATARLNSELRRRPPAVAGPSRLMLASILQSAELYELAEDQLRRAMELFNELDDADSYRSAESRLAGVLRAVGRIEESLAIRQNRHETAPRMDERRTELSFMIECLEMLGRYEEAASHYPQIISPPNPNARSEFSRAGTGYLLRSRHGWALLESGNLPESEHALRGALRAARDMYHAESSIVLAMEAAVAMARSLQGREESVEDRRRLVEGARFFAAVRHIENWDWIGRYLAHVGEHELALWFLEHGTQRVSDHRRYAAEHQSNLALLEKVREAIAANAEPTLPVHGAAH